MLERNDSARFCPACGGAAVDASSLAGGEARCRSCNWKGRNEELLVHYFQHGHGTEVAVLEAFAQDVKMLFAKQYGLPVLNLLYKWGFMPGKAEPKLLGRYLSAIAKAVFESVVRTREELEREKTNV